MRTTLVGWKNGPVVRPASLWLDAAPVGRGLRFVSSSQASAGRRPDRVLASSFTGRYHFGPDRPFLAAPTGEAIRLGAAEVRLLPGGGLYGASQLHFRSDEGTLLYTVGRRLGGTTLASPAVFAPADLWILRMDEPPGDGVAWERWLDGLAEQLSGGGFSRMSVADVWLAVELAVGLAARLPAMPRLDVPTRRLLRWTRAEGPAYAPASGGGHGIIVGAVGAGEVVLISDEGSESVRVPSAPAPGEIVAASAQVGAREILLTGAASEGWADALAAAGLSTRILGGGPPRLL